MVEDVLKLGKERQYVVFPLLSAEKRRVAGCVGSKHGGDSAGRSRFDWENREECSGDSLGGVLGLGTKAASSCFQPSPAQLLEANADTLTGELGCPTGLNYYKILYAWWQGWD